MSEDVVQDVFVYTLQYLNKYPNAEISKYILVKDTLKLCRKENQRQSTTIPLEDSLEDS
ncbi:MAG: hypothetical protein AABY22_36755 [Nanoarchaeota archaeon]